VTTQYVERPSLRGAWVATGLYTALLLVTYVPVVRDGTFRASDLAVAPLLGLIVLPFVLLPLGKRRYHSILLHDGELVVGRARVSAAGLRPVHEPAGPGVPLLGGAYGVPMGWATVVVESAEGQRWRIATRRPQQLAAALNGS
jgi:hypothetical protein